jgi:phosphate transport system substrate-binding protein
MQHYNGLNSGNGLPVSVGGITVNAHAYNIPTQPASAFNVPGESDTTTDCPNDVGWTVGTTVNRGIAPNGSGAGLNYLKAETGGTGPNPVGGTETAGQNFGCLDVARSSGGPRGLSNDPASFEYYAFALDAVSWATTSMKAPATLTTAQLQGIYKCTITDWSQIQGGGSGPIQRYLPNPASGTRKFFISNVLQLGSYTATDEAAGTNCPAVKGDGVVSGTGPILEENDLRAEHA